MNLITINQFTNNKYTNPNQDGADFVVIRAKDEAQIALEEKFNQLCEETQNLFIENQITEEEIQAEIDAYRRSE